MTRLLVIDWNQAPTAECTLWANCAFPSVRPLALRTPHGRPLREDPSLEPASALDARFPQSSVHLQLSSECAHSPLSVNIVPDRRSPAPDRPVQDPPDLQSQRLDLIMLQSRRSSAGPDSRRKQRLVSVDVPHSRQYSLIQYCRLDRPFRAPQPCLQMFRRDLQRIRTKMGPVRREQVLHRNKGLDIPEPARVLKYHDPAPRTSSLLAASLHFPPHVCMREPRRQKRGAFQTGHTNSIFEREVSNTPRHAEMDDHHSTGSPLNGDLLAAPPQRDDLVSFQQLRTQRLFRARAVGTLHKIGSPNDSTRAPRAHHVRRKTPANLFNLGQFRHGRTRQ